MLFSSCAAGTINGAAATWLWLLPTMEMVLIATIIIRHIIIVVAVGDVVVQLPHILFIVVVPFLLFIIVIVIIDRCRCCCLRCWRCRWCLRIIIPFPSWSKEGGGRKTTWPGRKRQGWRREQEKREGQRKVGPMLFYTYNILRSTTVPGFRSDRSNRYIPGVVLGTLLDRKCMARSRCIIKRQSESVFFNGSKTIVSIQKKLNRQPMILVPMHVSSSKKCPLYIYIV